MASYSHSQGKMENEEKFDLTLCRRWLRASFCRRLPCVFFRFLLTMVRTTIKSINDTRKMPRIIPEISLPSRLISWNIFPLKISFSATNWPSTSVMLCYNKYWFVVRFNIHWDYFVKCLPKMRAARSTPASLFCFLKLCTIGGASSTILPLPAVTSFTGLLKLYRQLQMFHIPESWNPKNTLFYNFADFQRFSSDFSLAQPRNLPVHLFLHGRFGPARDHRSSEHLNRRSDRVDLPNFQSV